MSLIFFLSPTNLKSNIKDNSGIWSDNVITFPEDQYKFTLPLNRDTENLYQNQRIIIDNRVHTEPRTWQISKINRISPNGIARFTVAQDRFDPSRDYIEHLDPDDLNSPIIGQWADYFSPTFEPEELDEPIITNSEIKYAGDEPELRIKDKYKKFNIEYSDGILRSGIWKCFILDEDTDMYVEFEKAELNYDGLNNGEVNIRLTIDPKKDKKWRDYIDSVVIIKYISDDGIETSLEMKIVPME